MRHCFLSPIPEIEEAIEYLNSAVDAFINGDRNLAARLIMKADISKISEFDKSITGKTDPKIHLQESQPKTLPEQLRDTTRMPGGKKEREIFAKDGWRCRYCGTRVISKDARKIIKEEFPIETHWASKESERHTALHSQAASLDHIIPHSRGGKNEYSNFITACGPCQFGRNCWTLEEVGFSDPRDRPPVVDGWDGLTRLIVS